MNPNTTWEKQIVNEITACLEATKKLRDQKPDYPGADETLRLLKRADDRIEFHNRANPDRVSWRMDLALPRIAELIEEVETIIRERDNDNEQTPGPFS